MGRREFRDERLFKRGRFIWARVRDEHGRIQRVTTRCTEEKAAILFADEWERRAANPSYRRAAETTLGDAIRDWLKELRRRRVSEATYGIALTKSGHFVRLWGEGWPLQRITNDLVLQFIDTREGEGVKPMTVKKELGALKGFLEWARFRGTFPYDLATVIPPRYSAQYKPRTRAPSLEELAKLLAELEDRRAAHVAYIGGTGARWSESCRAQRNDVDFKGLLVELHGTKTERSAGVVPITGITWPLLVFALEKAPGKTVLFDRWQNSRRDILAACKRAGIAALTANDLRRAFASWHRKAVLESGGSKEGAAELVSVLLRHTTDKLAQTTYARVTGADIGPSLRAISPVPVLYAATTETAPTGQNGSTK